MSTLVREWGIPEVSLRLVSDNSIQFVLEDNHQLYAKLENKTLPRRVDTSVELPSGFTALVKMLLPPGIDEEEDRRKYHFMYEPLFLARSRLSSLWN